MSVASICDAYAVQLEATREDASLATDRPLRLSEAREMVARLEAEGLEASWAPDHDDRERAWVYVTEVAS